MARIESHSDAGGNIAWSGIFCVSFFIPDEEGALGAFYIRLNGRGGSAWNPNAEPFNSPSRVVRDLDSNVELPVFFRRDLSPIEQSSQYGEALPHDHRQREYWRVLCALPMATVVPHTCQ